MPPLSRKAQIAAIVCACFAMLSVGVSREEVIERPVVQKIAPTKVVYKTKTKIVKVKETVPSRPPSGFVTVDDCRSIHKGMRFQDMLYQYGWPAYDEGDSYSGFFDYPIVGNHDKTCSVDIINMQVESAVVR